MALDSKDDKKEQYSQSIRSSTCLNESCIIQMNCEYTVVDIDMTFELISVPEDLVVCIDLDNCVKVHPGTILNWVNCLLHISTLSVLIIMQLRVKYSISAVN